MRLKLAIPSIPCDSESELFARLSRDHCEHFLYRGQAAEHRRRYPLSPGPFRDLTDRDLERLELWSFDPPDLRLPVTLVRELMDLPSLIPTNTRTYEQHVQGAADSAFQEDAFDETMVHFWTTVCLFFAGLACVTKQDRGGLEWLSEQWSADPAYLYKLRSIGQHYGMDTGLLDATSSIAVALWFATHDFQKGAYRAHSHSVLYRIDRRLLLEAEEWFRTIPEHEGQFDAATTDIRDTPASIAPRASRQQGWSLAGWDHPRMVIRMAASNGIVRYDFPTAEAACAENRLHLEWLAPPVEADPMRAIFERFWPSQPRSLADAQRWIDQHWNPVAREAIHISTDGNWYEQVQTEFPRILDHYFELNLGAR